ARAGEEAADLWQQLRVRVGRVEVRPAPPRPPLNQKPPRRAQRTRADRARAARRRTQRPCHRRTPLADPEDRRNARPPHPRQLAPPARHPPQPTRPRRPRLPTFTVARTRSALTTVADRSGRYWVRTSDLSLVRRALYQLS